jgi:hypothetical protein
VLIRTIGAIRVQSCALFIAARNSFGSSGVRQELAGTTIKIRGSGFKEGARIEAILGGSPTCLTFAKKAKVKSGGTVLVQRGKLTNGRKLDSDINEEDEVILFRLVNPLGVQRIATSLK